MDAITLLKDRQTFARKWTNDLIADIDESLWFTPPGQHLGHVAWQLGHIAASQIVLVHMRCFGRPFGDCAPADYMGTFARGSKPVPDPSKYPPIPVIREFFNRTQADVMDRISTLTPADLDQPTEPHPMFTNRGGAIGMVVTHEAFHAGQIALIRRLMGKQFLR
jgi:DinB superfamily